MAKAVFQMTAEDQDAVRSLMKLVESQRRVESQTTRTNEATRKQKNLLGEIGKHAASFASVTAAIGLTTKALRDMNAEAKSGAESLRGQAEGLKRLLQVSGGDPAEFKRLQGRAASMSTTWGMNAAESQALTFMLKSSGRMGLSDFYGRVSTFADPTKAVETAQSLQEAFGVGETGGDQAILNKLMAASSISKLDLSQLGPAAVQVAGHASLIGARDEEALAALAATAAAAGSGERAATGLNAVMAMANKQGFGGQGLDAAFQRLSTSKDLKKLLGSEREFAKGFNLYSQNRDAIRAAVAQIDAEQYAAGTPGSLVNRTWQVAESDATTAALLGDARAREQARMKTDARGATQLEREAVMAQTRADATTPLEGWARGQAQGIASGLGMSPEGVEWAGSTPYIDAVAGAAGSASVRLEVALNRLSDRIGQMVRGQHGMPVQTE